MIQCIIETVNTVYFMYCSLFNIYYKGNNLKVAEKTIFCKPIFI